MIKDMFYVIGGVIVAIFTMYVLVVIIKTALILLSSR